MTDHCLPRPHRRLAVVAALASAVLALSARPAQAQLHVEITSGVTDPIPIAIVPFAAAGTPPGGVDVADVVQHDLDGSGRFRSMARHDMLATPSRAQDVITADWRMARNDYIVVGRMVTAGAQISLECDLINLLTGQRLASPRVTAPITALRSAAHRISDAIYEKVLGVKGAFATRIAYIAVDGTAPNQRFQLIVADADGENSRIITESREPLMSPAWSPDGEWLAYVSFERHASSIYVQKMRTGERRQVSARIGINSAPAWSPDGSKIAVTLSGSGGNLDVYVLDLATQGLTRVTDDPAIDTEPVWAADGRSLFFTSDRSGGPQIYRVGLGGTERPKRLTFVGSYNARPRLSPDGAQLAMVTLDNGNYRVAVQDLASGTQRVLSKGRLDESPSFAPNGAMLIYAGRDSGRDMLETVSVDGLTSQRLKSDRGAVREPVWGPFLP